MTDRQEPSLETVVPKDPFKAYDMKEVITKLVDSGRFFEIQPDHAKNIIVGFGRFDGTLGST